MTDRIRRKKDDSSGVAVAVPLLSRVWGTGVIAPVPGSMRTCSELGRKRESLRAVGRPPGAFDLFARGDMRHLTQFGTIGPGTHTSHASVSASKPTAASLIEVLKTISPVAQLQSGL